MPTMASSTVVPLSLPLGMLLVTMTGCAGAAVGPLSSPHADTTSPSPARPSTALSCFIGLPFRPCATRR